MSDTKFNIDNQASAFYEEAKDDYISLSHVIGNYSDYFSENSVLDNAAFSIIRRLLVLGLVAGNLTCDNGFAPWPEQNPDAVIKRIVQERQTRGDDQLAYDNTWFNLPSYS